MTGPTWEALRAEADEYRALLTMSAATILTHRLPSHPRARELVLEELRRLETSLDCYTLNLPEIRMVAERKLRQTPKGGGSSA